MIGFHHQDLNVANNNPNANVVHELTEQQNQQHQQQMHPLGLSGADNSTQQQKQQTNNSLLNGNKTLSNAPTQQNNQIIKKDLSRQQHLSSSPDTR